jgi:hypothetical protein
MAPFPSKKTSRTSAIRLTTGLQGAVAIKVGLGNGASARRSVKLVCQNCVERAGDNGHQEATATPGGFLRGRERCLDASFTLASTSSPTLGSRRARVDATAPEQANCEGDKFAAGTRLNRWAMKSAVLSDEKRSSDLGTPVPALSDEPRIQPVARSGCTGFCLSALAGEPFRQVGWVVSPPN